MQSTRRSLWDLPKSVPSLPKEPTGFGQEHKKDVIGKPEFVEVARPPILGDVVD
jgi:hypothetical protein